MALPDESANPFRVLVTGFGPFAQYQVNPSWLAVKDLQNEILYTDVSAERPPRPDPSKTAAPPPPIPSSSKRAPPPQPPPAPIEPAQEIPLTPRPIHISTLEIPMLYDSVLSIIPGLHARPPVLPPDAPQSTLPPPTTAFDFILHIGVAGRGPLRMERVGHKLGYHMKDASNKYACTVRKEPREPIDQHGTRTEHVGAPGAPSGIGPTGATGANPNPSHHGATSSGPTSSHHGPSISSTDSSSALGSSNTSFVGTSSSGLDRDRSAGLASYGSGIGLGGTMELVSPAVASGEGQESASRPTRGFAGPAYDTLPDEATTDIDCTKLVQDLKLSGIDQIYTSMDAGHYLCDFIYYCSLVEAKRSSKPYEKRRLTQVLCMHCCPPDLPLSTAEVTDAIRRIIIWVCNQQQLQDDITDGVAGAS